MGILTTTRLWLCDWRRCVAFVWVVLLVSAPLAGAYSSDLVVRSGGAVLVPVAHGAQKNRSLSAHSSAKKAVSRIPQLKPIRLAYEVYVGGTHLIGADIRFSATKGGYTSRIEGRTLGIWHRFFPWNTTLEAVGRIRGDELVPIGFESRDVWGHKLKVTRLKFAPDGEARAEFEPPAGVVPASEEVTLDQRRGALDPVTALLQMLAHLAVEHDCNIEVPVFDGKRRFDVMGADASGAEKVEEDIDAGDYGVFKGKARVCQAGFRMVSGQWTDRQKSGFWKKSDTQQGREPFRVWLASIDPGLPELPVRLESNSIWGRIVIHLTGWNYEPQTQLN
ncbi:MAG: DUF3108 domain-containing protein [Bdellovibrionales bacterium]